MKESSDSFEDISCLESPPSLIFELPPPCRKSERLMLKEIRNGGEGGERGGKGRGGSGSGGGDSDGGGDGGGGGNDGGGGGEGVSSKKKKKCYPSLFIPRMNSIESWNLYVIWVMMFWYFII